MNPFAIHQERLGEYVCSHEFGVTVVKLATGPAHHFVQEGEVDTVCPTHVTDSGILARCHDLNGGGIILPPFNWQLASQ